MMRPLFRGPVFRRLAQQPLNLTLAVAPRRAILGRDIDALQGPSRPKYQYLADASDHASRA